MRNQINITERAKSSLFFLSIQDLSFNIDNNIIFSNLSFNVSYDKILLIKGKVGSGKTTLLKLISGIYSDYNNKIIHKKNNENIKSIYIHSRPEFNFVTGYIKDEITFAGLNIDNFNEYIDKTVYNLSGGELKKLSILMALSMSQDNVLLLDEPTDMLDDIQAEIMSNFIIEKSKTRPFIISSHDNYFDNMADVIINL